MKSIYKLNKLIFLSIIFVIIISTNVYAKELEEVSVDEIRKSIENGTDIYLNGVRIKGDLYLNVNEVLVYGTTDKGLELVSQYLAVTSNISNFENDSYIIDVKGKMIIENSIFENDLYIYNVDFMKYINFHNTTFNGDVYFNNVNFIGNVFFDQVNFMNDARFENSNFSKDANFIHANFNFVSFENTSFANNTNFNSAHFNDKAFFNNVVFSKDANFDQVNFMNDAWFENSNFSKDANFIHANFNFVSFVNTSFANNTNFNSAHFNDNAYFNDAVFKDANFKEVYFMKFVKFQNTSFEGISNFILAHFNGNTFFNNANFKDEVFFSLTVFGDSGNVNHIVSFGGANFRKKACFNGSSFSGYTNFLDANFDDYADFSFTNFNKLHLYGATFKYVNLFQSDYNRVDVKWSAIKNALFFEGSTYLQLIKNFRDIERFDDADEVYYEYQDYKRKSNGGLWDYLTWILCGYGVKPLRTIIVGLFIMLIIFPIIYLLLGMSVFSAIECSFVVFFKGYDPEFARNDLSGSSKLINLIQHMKIWISAKKWPNRYNLNLKKRLNWDLIGKFYINLIGLLNINRKILIKFFMIIETFFGWLILALFIVTLVNVMIRP